MATIRCPASFTSLRTARFTLSCLAAATLAACGGGDDIAQLKADRAAFPLVEATVESFHAAMRNGDVSCRDVVQGYLDRIAAYDADPSASFPGSPGLHSVITVSSTALAQADLLDARSPAAPWQARCIASPCWRRTTTTPST